MYTFLKKLFDLHYKKNKNYLIYQKITSFTIFSYKNNWISIIPPNFAQFLGSQIHLDRTKIQFPIQQVRPSHRHPHGTTTRLSSVVPPCVVLCAAATTPHYFSSSSSLETWTEETHLMEVHYQCHPEMENIENALLLIENLRSTIRPSLYNRVNYIKL